MNNTIYCGQCGKPNVASNKFCGSCGKPITPIATTNVYEAHSQTGISEIACPHCRREDAVSKVSGIVSGQSVNERGTIYGERQTPFISSSRSSALAQQLIPPNRPLNISAGEDILSRVSCGVIAGIILLIAIGDLLISNGSTVGVGLFFLGGIGVFFALKGFDSDKQKTEAAKKYNEKLQFWQYAISRWQKSYYCGRCDVVFVKGEGNYVVPSNFYNLIYK